MNNSNPTNFNVTTITESEPNNSRKYVHWAESLQIVITKGKNTIVLDSNEAQQLVNELPQTVSGRYK